MAVSKKRIGVGGVLHVVANPYCGGHRGLDHTGRAAAHVTHYGDPLRFVGAEVDQEASKAEARIVGHDIKGIPQTVPTCVVKHHEGAVETIHCVGPDAFKIYKYHERLLRDGATFPATEEVAIRTRSMRSRVKKDDKGAPVKDAKGRDVLESYFMPPDQALAEAKAVAIAEFEREHGFEPACKFPPEAPAATTSTPEPAAPKATPPTPAPAPAASPAPVNPTPAAPAATGGK